MKKCGTCGEIKDLIEYNKHPKHKDGLDYICKSCQKEYLKQYNVDNKDKRKQYNLGNEDIIKEYNKEYNLKNKSKIKDYNNYYHKNRRNKDPIYKLTQYIRSRIYGVLGGGRSKRSLDILGCSPSEFRQHLERQFEPWMSWDNMGGKRVLGPNTTWDIDHIIPLSSAQTTDDVYRLNHYTNLRPLCSHQNRFIKRNGF